MLQFKMRQNRVDIRYTKQRVLFDVAMEFRLKAALGFRHVGKAVVFDTDVPNIGTLERWIRRTSVPFGRRF